MIKSAEIKKFIKDYREAEETEEWDVFYELYGGVEECLEYLVMFLEQEIKNERND